MNRPGSGIEREDQDVPARKPSALDGRTLAERLASDGGGTSVPAHDEAASLTDALVDAARADLARRASAPATARRCLIVDDSRVIRKVSRRIVEQLGFQAIEAENGEEALARCQQAMPDLVLTDWNMPEMDGIRFVEKLRAIPTPKPPVVVFCTSNGEARDIHDGIAAGADDYIVKPFDEAALKAKLENLGRS